MRPGTGRSAPNAERETSLEGDYAKLHYGVPDTPDMVQVAGRKKRVPIDAICNVELSRIVHRSELNAPTLRLPPGGDRVTTGQRRIAR